MDTAYTSRKMWFGLRFILEESPIQIVSYVIKQVGFWTRVRQDPHLSTYILFLLLNFFSLVYFMISLTEHCVYCKLNCTLEKEIKKSKFVVMETLVHTRKIKWKSLKKKTKALQEVY